MKAAHTVGAGGPDMLVLVDIPLPDPLPTEVLVRVHATSINAVDWKIRRGDFPPGALGSHPFVQGWDVAGVVESATRVTRFAPGDRVHGLLWFPRQAGAYAEYVAAPALQFALIPEHVDFIEAAARPLAGLTAWQTLHEHAHISHGSKVLITAAAGGVGHIATQIANALGADVTGTATSSKHNFLRDHGVHHCIDYTTGPLANQVTGQDVALDLVGGDSALDLIRTLRPGGLLIETIGLPSPAVADAAEQAGVTIVPFLVEPDGRGLDDFNTFASEHHITAHVSRTFPLASIAAAHAAAETSHGTGKMVVTINDSAF